jgi:DHA1 family multidrug resistance protein-like MFS transporter
MGLLQVGLWSGVAAGPLIGGAIADTLGFRATFVVTSILLLIGGVLVWWGVHETAAPAARTARPSPNFLSDWRRIFAMPGVGMTYTLRFASWLGQTMLVPIMPLFIQALLLNSQRVSTFTGLVVGLSSAAGTASAIYLGRLGDRVGHRRIFIACALAAAIFYLPQTFVTAGWQLLILQAFTGAAVGGTTPAVGALLARYTLPGEEGTVYGLDSAIGSGARAVAPLVGAVIATSFGLQGIFVATALIFLLVAVLAIWRLPEAQTVPQPQST